MAKTVAIITRAFNRLEYTINTIQSVKENTNYPEYKHIIVDNGSSDGTREWLTWIQNYKSPWFEKVFSHLPSENYGDWGGMVVGAKAMAKDCQYIVQLDNDIAVPCGWLNALVQVLESSKMDSVMLKRSGVKNQIQIQKPRNFKLLDGTVVKTGEIPFVVACYITKADFFFSVCDQVKRCRDFGKLLKKKCMKITSINCHHMDGYHPTRKDYIQHQKYPKNQMTWQKFS